MKPPTLAELRAGKAPASTLSKLKHVPSRDALCRMNRRLEDALTALLSAVTSKAATDSALPIAWSGSPVQNRAIYAAVDQARAAIQQGEGR